MICLSSGAQPGFSEGGGGGGGGQLPANVTGKAIYNDFCLAVSGTVMLGTPSRGAGQATDSLSVTARSVRRHRRLIHPTTTHFYHREGGGGEYHVYFVYVGPKGGHVPPVPLPPPWLRPCLSL